MRFVFCWTMLTTSCQIRMRRRRPGKTLWVGCGGAKIGLGKNSATKKVLRVLVYRNMSKLWWNPFFASQLGRNCELRRPMTSSCIVPTEPRNPCGISRFVKEQYHFAPIDPQKKYWYCCQKNSQSLLRSCSWIHLLRICHLLGSLGQELVGRDVNFSPKTSWDAWHLMGAKDWTSKTGNKKEFLGSNRRKTVVDSMMQSFPKTSTNKNQSLEFF